MKYFLLVLVICNQPLFAQRPIDTTAVFTIGGIKQVTRIKGQDVSRPLLLFLHGGPGSSLMNKIDQINKKLQQHFVVIHWDQRETGETLQKNKTTQPLTLQMFYNDTRDIIDSLLRHFNQRKLYLIGYSWGSGLGFHIADKYPELLYAYMPVSPVVDQWTSEAVSLNLLKQNMGIQAQKELEQVKIPFQNAEQLYYHRKWLFKNGGKNFVSLKFVQNWSVTWFNVWIESCSVNLFNSLPEIKCPVYFFAGENDLNTNAEITAKYYDKLIAPKKDLFVFKDAGHGLPETHYNEFQDIIINKILPVTFER